MTNHNIRYPAKAKIRAQALRKAGWSSAKIKYFLEKEMGISPGFTTIRSWTDPRYDDRRREKARKREHVRWLEKNPVKPYTRISPPRKLARMQALHDAGLSQWAIGVVAGVWWGEPLSEKQVKRRLGRSGGQRGKALSDFGEEQLAVVRDLRERGVSYREISERSQELFSEDLCESTVRYRLGKAA